MFQLRGSFPPDMPDPRPDFEDGRGCLVVLAFGLVLFAVIVALLAKMVFHLDLLASVGL